LFVQVSEGLNSFTDAGSSLNTVLATLLQRVMTCTNADRGNVQLFRPRVNGLTIALQQGFGQVFLSHFALVADDGSACGRASRALSQVVIEDVHADLAFAPHLEIARASGFSAVQSTPLVSTSGSLVGMVSTHFAEPHRPSTEELELLVSYGRSYGAVLSDLVEQVSEPAIEVLVVDDNEAMRSSLALILRSAGYRVVEASDGLEALTHLAVADVGLMLLDVDMPGLDGIALLEQLGTPPPTIVISGKTDDGRVDAVSAKVHGYYKKPVTPSIVLSHVADVIGAGTS
jgi:CheY-like chemotaxis protein